MARIRENQRRSRARRKEYLQELEGRWRRCEQAGAEASSELQAAARRVADENKKLRALLRERGVRDDDVAAYLARASGGGEPAKADGAPASQLLDLLTARKDCGNGCADAAEADQKPTAWRPLWTDPPSALSQPPPPPALETSLAPPPPPPPPPRCDGAAPGCCAAPSLSPLSPHPQMLYGPAYPQPDPNVALRDYSRSGYGSAHTPGIAVTAAAFDTRTHPSALLAGEMMPHVDYTTITAAALVAPHPGCVASDPDGKLPHGTGFALTDQYATHSVTL